MNHHYYPKMSKTINELKNWVEDEFNDFHSDNRLYRALTVMHYPSVPERFKNASIKIETSLNKISNGKLQNFEYFSIFFTSDF